MSDLITEDICNYLRTISGDDNDPINYAANLIEQQQQRIAELKQALTDDAIAKIMLEKMALENGQLDIQMSGNIFHIFCEAFVKTFKGAGAENYLTTEFHSPELGAFTVTMQRSQGMTVYEKLRKVEQERDELSATVERLRDIRKGFGSAANDAKVLIALIESIDATPQQTLNAVKREALLTLARDLSSTGEIESNVIECIEIYANTKYPTGVRVMIGGTIEGQNQRSLELIEHLIKTGQLTLHGLLYLLHDTQSGTELAKIAELSSKRPLTIQTGLAERDAEVVEKFIDNQLRTACLANGWDTESSAYQVSLILEQYANQLRNGSNQ